VSWTVVEELEERKRNDFATKVIYEMRKWGNYRSR